MFMPFLGSTFLLLIPALILAIYAQIKVKKTYKIYSKKQSISAITGSQAAKDIIESNNIKSISVELTPGEMTDHYDPINKKLGLSNEVYHGSSIASLCIAAHEAGHVLQHEAGYMPANLRGFIYPVANFGSKLAFPLFFIGLIFLRSKFLMDLGIFLYIGALVFTLVTLPVEFDASRRALVQLQNGKYLTSKELEGAKKVLSAAALTYVAAAAMAVLQLIRLLVLRSED